MLYVQYVEVLYISVVQDVARGPKLALWGFLLGPFKKNFL